MLYAIYRAENKLREEWADFDWKVKTWGSWPWRLGARWMNI